MFLFTSSFIFNSPSLSPFPHFLFQFFFVLLVIVVTRMVQECFSLIQQTPFLLVTLVGFDTMRDVSLEIFLIKI
jgi:hypothetical protein